MMEVDYKFELNGILNSLQKYDRVFRNFQSDLKHKLLISVVEPDPFEGPEIFVNFHFNGFRKSRDERNSWDCKFYMYSKDRGMRYIHPREEYPELLKKLYEEILEIARIETLLKQINGT